MCGAMLSKSLIQFSVDGWSCVPSLLFDLRPNYGGGNEIMTNLDSILKSRDITLLTKVHIFKAMVFPLVKHVQMWVGSGLLWGQGH